MAMRTHLTNVVWLENSSRKGAKLAKNNPFINFFASLRLYESVFEIASRMMMRR